MMLRSVVIAFLIISSGSIAIQAMDVKPAGGRDGSHSSGRNLRCRTKSTSSITATLSDDLDHFLTEDNFDFDRLVKELMSKMLESKKKVETKDFEALVTEYLCGLCVDRFAEDAVSVAKEKFLDAVQCMPYELIK